MKYIALPIALVFFVALGIVGRRQPKVQAALIFLLGFVLFIDLSSFDLNFFGNREYRGTDRGFEITIVDLIAIGLLCSLREKSKFPPPYRFAFLAYFIPCALSVVQADITTLALYPVFKLVRMYFFLYVATRALTDEKGPKTLLTGIAFGLLFEMLLCLKMRYFDHFHQVPGAFTHQNSLGMAVNLWAPIMFALLLRDRIKLASAAYVAAAVCVVLTLSRGAMVVFALGLVVTFSASVVFRKLTRRKLWIAVAGTVAGTIFLLKSIDTIIRRFEHAPLGSAMARADFNAAARLMVEDNPFGVGMNMFSHALQTEYAERVGIDPESYGASGVAHHVYYLTLAETGWLGLLGYIILITVPLVIALRSARRLWGSIRAEVMIGCAIGMVGFHAAGFLEWAARQTVLSYMFFLMAALVEGTRRAYVLSERQRAREARERDLQQDG